MPTPDSTPVNIVIFQTRRSCMPVWPVREHFLEVRRAGRHRPAGRCSSGGAETEIATERWRIFQAVVA